MRLNLELLNRSYVKEGISHPWVGVGGGGGAWSPLAKRGSFAFVPGNTSPVRIFVVYKLP